LLRASSSGSSKSYIKQGSAFSDNPHHESELAIEKSESLTLSTLDIANYEFGLYVFQKREIRIPHPYTPVEKDNSHREFIKVQYEGELYKNEPHGLGTITYTDGWTEYLNFKGYAIFTKGKIASGPALFLCGDG
jgi:hypothetical protein